MDVGSPTWRTACGTVRYWRNVLPEPDGPAGNGGARRRRSVGVAPLGNVAGGTLGLQVVQSIVAERQPRRSRTVVLEATGGGFRFGVIVRRDEEFWAEHDGQVVAGPGPEGKQLAGDEALHLLDPQVVVFALEPLQPAGEREILERRVTVMRAQPPEGREVNLAQLLGMAPGGVHELCFDAGTGVVLRVARLVGGDEVEGVEWLALALDGPVAEDAFMPPGT